MNTASGIVAEAQRVEPLFRRNPTLRAIVARQPQQLILKAFDLVLQRQILPPSVSVEAVCACIAIDALTQDEIRALCAVPMTARKR